MTEVDFRVPRHGRDIFNRFRFYIMVYLCVRTLTYALVVNRNKIHSFSRTIQQLGHDGQGCTYASPRRCIARSSLDVLRQRRRAEHLARARITTHNPVVSHRNLLPPLFASVTLHITGDGRMIDAAIVPSHHHPRH